MAEWTRQTPWRQGFLLPDEAAKILSLEHPVEPSNTVVIVATHDCDLAQTPENEPWVEVIIGRRISAADGNFTHAKTARTLHISFIGASTSWAEFNANAKMQIPKPVLADYFPDNERRLPPESLVIYQRWLASRYHRSAFPDEFERRLKETKLAERISKAVKPTGDCITAVLFDVDDGREENRSGPDDVYVLDITLLHAITPDFGAAELAAKTAKDAIKKAFESRLRDKESQRWQNIELRYFDVISEEALSYRQYTHMKRWRLDHISLAADPQQPTPAE